MHLFIAELVHDAVVQSAVGALCIDMKICRQIREPETGQRKKISGQRKGVHIIVDDLSAQGSDCAGLEKFHVEAVDIVADENVVSGEGKERFQGGSRRGGVLHHFVRDTVYFCGIGRDRTSRIYQSGEIFLYLPATDFDSGDLDDLVVFGIESCGFQIKNYIVIRVGIQSCHDTCFPGKSVFGILRHACSLFFCAFKIGLVSSLYSFPRENQFPAEILLKN